MAQAQVKLLRQVSVSLTVVYCFHAGDFQDAYILGRILSYPKVGRKNLPEALTVYDAIRQPIGNDVVERSLKMGFLYEFHPDYLPKGIEIDELRAGNRDELQKLVDEMKCIWEFHWSEMPESDWKRAQKLLEEH